MLLLDIIRVTAFFRGAIMFENLIYAQQATPTSQSQPGWGSVLLPFVLIFFVFYFIVIRPQKKEQKKQDDIRKSLQKGDKVVTIGGIIGTVTIVKDEIVVLKVDDNTRIEFRKNAISYKIPEPEKNKEQISAKLGGPK
ncbi:MAG: preprotein translocase subunit YajC [Candidatus Hydrogenedentota bacterium]